MAWGAGFGPSKETSGTESVSIDTSDVNKDENFRERVWLGALASVLQKKPAEQNQ